MLQDPTAALRWESKPDPKEREALKAWNGEFSVSGICRKLEQQDEGAPAWARHLYQYAIDSGAHPNEQGVFGNMAMERFDDGGVRVGMNYLHGWGPVLVAAAKFVAEIGMFAVRLYVLTMHAGAERDELQHDLDRSSQELSKLSAADLPLFEAATQGTREMPKP